MANLTNVDEVEVALEDDLRKQMKNMGLHDVDESEIMVSLAWPIPIHGEANVFVDGDLHGTLEYIAYPSGWDQESISVRAYTSPVVQGVYKEEVEEPDEEPDEYSRHTVTTYIEGSEESQYQTFENKEQAKREAERIGRDGIFYYRTGGKATYYPPHRIESIDIEPE